jgi:hypothetical protein
MCVKYLFYISKASNENLLHSRVRSDQVPYLSTKHDFPNFAHFCKIFSQIGMCKISYTFVKNESYQIFMNICKLNLAYFTSIIQ